MHVGSNWFKLLHSNVMSHACCFLVIGFVCNKVIYMGTQYFVETRLKIEYLKHDIYRGGLCVFILSYNSLSTLLSLAYRQKKSVQWPYLHLDSGSVF